MSALADRDAVKQIVAAIQRLAQLQQIGFALQFDAELTAHRAVAAVAADQIIGLEFGHRTVLILDPRTDGMGVLFERHEFAAIPDVHTGYGFGDFLQQRLERVLRDKLIGLERHGAVIVRGDLGLRLRDRRVGQMQQRRLDQ